MIFICEPRWKYPLTYSGVNEIKQENSHYDYRIHLEKNITPQEFLKTLISRDINVDLFEIYQPSLDEIFIQIVTQTGNLNE